MWLRAVALNEGQPRGNEGDLNTTTAMRSLPGGRRDRFCTTAEIQAHFAK